MKFIKKLVGDAKQNWDNLNEEQKLNTFALMWEGQQIPSNRWVSRIKNKLPGLHYKLIYSLIEKVCTTENKEDRKKLFDELDDFYSRPINEEQKKYYPGLRSELASRISLMDKRWLNEIILPDLKACEELQKLRMMKRYGLLK